MGPSPAPWSEGPRRVRIPYRGFLAILLPFIFSSSFDAICERSWLYFASQLDSLNPAKSMKNRCQDAFPCWPLTKKKKTIFTPDFHPLNLKNRAPAAERARIFKKNSFRSWHGFLNDLGANLPPLSFPKSSKIQAKIDTHQLFDWFLNRFLSHLGSNLGPKLGPCWPHFRSKWGGAVACSHLFCWFYVIFRFFRTGPLGYPIGGRPESDGVPVLGSVVGSFFYWFLAVAWGIWAQELMLDGLVGLREAQRIIKI